MIAPDHLVTLSAVRRTGSVVRAAAELGYTPSAASQQIERLERHVGAAVLERVGRGIALTELGRHLVDESADILLRLEALESGLRRVTGGPTAGSVRLAAFATSVRGLLAPAMRRLHAAEPGLAGTVLELDPHEAIDLVATGGADAAVVHNRGDLPLPFPTHLDVVDIGIDTADVLVPAEHPLTTGSGVSALGREPLPVSVVAVPLIDPAPTRRVMTTWRRSMAPSPAIARGCGALISEADERLDRRRRR
ncbi:MAG: LysR family transcriptional regulator [Phycicoccus sp.]